MGGWTPLSSFYPGRPGRIDVLPVFFDKDCRSYCLECLLHDRGWDRQINRGRGVNAFGEKMKPLPRQVVGWFRGHCARCGQTGQEPDAWLETGGELMILVNGRVEVADPQPRRRKKRSSG